MSLLRASALALTLLLPSLSFAATDDAYVQSLVARAKELKLGESKAWLRLLHYRPGGAGGWKSDADGPSFFLAPNGKRNPDAELAATLEGLFWTSAPEGRVHPQCQFPARAAWLYKELRFDLTKMPLQQCDKLNDFLARVAPVSATLVFSSYYMNNPASAFGHTFLRLNKAPRGLRISKDELRDYAFNFAASVDTDNKVIYGVKGLLGGFHGDWTHQLYFYKVREYSEFESRDLWEYDLALSPEELAMLTAHLWELGGTWFDYYYLDENCSFQIVAAIEAVAPRLELTKYLGPFVIPADTLRAVMKNEGLVEGIYYRPSIRRQFETRAAGLTDDELELVHQLDENQQLPFPPEMTPKKQAELIDAALDYVDLRDAEAIIFHTDRKVTERRQALLERRAQIRVQSPPLQIHAPEDKQPHRGHYSSRGGFGVGAEADEGTFFRYEARIAFHDLGDASAGYPELSHIEFAPIRIRHSVPLDHFMLEHAYLARIMSLTPMGRFDKSSSWHVRIGAATLRDGVCAKSPYQTPEEKEGRCLAGEVAGGTGLTVGFFNEKLVLYGLADAALHGSGAINGPWGIPLRLSLAPHAGMRAKLTDRFTFLLDGSYFFHGEEGDNGSAFKVRESWDATAHGRFHLNERFAFDLEAHALSTDGRAPDGIEGAAMMLIYF